jgi:hypothetical protein
MPKGKIPSHIYSVAKLIYKMHVTFGPSSRKVSRGEDKKIDYRLQVMMSEISLLTCRITITKR